MSRESLLDRLPTHRHVLGNGLTVLVREDRSAPVVAVVTHVRAGYFDEPDPIVGISHVLEHMYFKGTERRGVGEIARETKAAGGYLNAGTIYDHTSYYTVLPSSSLEQALDIQSDALQHSAIDEDELRRELQVIIQEAQRKLDNPEAVAQERLFEAMFDVHRIRRWRIGTPDALARFTREDVLRYYRALYHPPNTIVTIAGDVDAARAFELAERHYGNMPRGESTRDPGPPEPPARGFRFRELDGDVLHTYLEWGWRSPGTLHTDTAPLDLLAVVLGQGRAARLYHQVRDAGLVEAISSYNYTPTQVGVFGVSAELRPEQAEAAVVRIAGVLRALREHPVAPHEVERAQRILEARFVRRLETAEGQARLLAEWEALGDWRLADDYIARLRGADASALRRVAAEYLDPALGTLLLYRPSAAAATDLARMRAAVLEADAISGASAPPAPIPALPLRPPRVATREEGGVQLHTTSWGGHIVVLPRQGSPMVSLAVTHAGGALHECVAHAGLTRLMVRAAVKGTRTRSGARLAEDVEALGTSISAASGADGFEWSMTLPAQHAESGVELLADLVLEPAFEDAALDRERGVALSELEQLRDDMYQYPLRLAFDAAWNAHPYGFSLDAAAAALPRLDAAVVRDWHRRRVLESPPWIFLVGDVRDPEALAARVEARFARAVPADGQPPAIPVWPSQPAARVESRRKAQTAIVAAFPGPARHHADQIPLRVLANAVSGLGGRLFEELRSRRSLAYTVSAYPLARWQAGAFVGYIGTAPEREHEARTALVAELLRSAEERVSDTELERARRFTIGAWQIRRQTNGRQLADLADALRYGRGIEELREFEARVQAVDAEGLRAAAERWLDPARLVTGTVRGGA
ncbi:MAG TPA: pitrilysin family protein [Longimicrobiales bacterium]|nr:pitrilysin family protein [Longimicrobiales bacterium]